MASQSFLTPIILAATEGGGGAAAGESCGGRKQGRAHHRSSDKRLSRCPRKIETVHSSRAYIQDRVESSQVEKLDQMVGHVEHDDVAVILGHFAIDADQHR